MAGLRWRALAPFGVEIEVDLAAPLSEDEGAELVALLWEHGLILARGQRLTTERQRELCALAGPILLREGESGYLSTENASAPSLSELSWHADAAYTEAPFDALSLHAIDVVDEASSTRFVDTAAALATLPADLLGRLEGAEIEMISPHYSAIAGRSCDDPDVMALRRATLPAIRRNPHSGRECLWTSELQTTRVIGLPAEESRALLHAVFDHLYRPEHILEHRWHTGDLLIWDNIALQHMRGPLGHVGKRVLQRVIVGVAGVAPHIRERRGRIAARLSPPVIPAEAGIHTLSAAPPSPD